MAALLGLATLLSVSLLRAPARPTRRSCRLMMADVSDDGGPPELQADDGGPPTRISLSALLSTCVDAAGRGCAAIRAVQAKRADGGGLDVSRKIADDPKSALTEADLAAQAAIVSALQAEWPGLRIVGEEDDDAAAAAAIAADSPGGSLPPLRRDLCPAAASELEADLSDLVVFVDPLDGVRCRDSNRGCGIHTRMVCGLRYSICTCVLAVASRPRTPSDIHAR